MCKGIITISLLSIAGIIAFKATQNPIDDRILSCTIDPKTQNLQMFWKNDQGEILGSIQDLKTFVESKNFKLVFAMNGGMFTGDFTPQGLFIQNNKTLTALDTTDGYGNFYLKPNGIFYLTKDSTPIVCKTSDFVDNGNIQYATQSGPMLVIDGQIHPVFKEGSKHLHIRNGVGILPDNKVLFAMSKEKINLCDFAKFFQNAGCKNALYLDGFVSRTYLPAKNWIQTDGNFGVIIGVIEHKM